MPLESKQETADHPRELTGGCLCGSIRYTVSTPTWPPEGSTCQCTTCRKWTSALISHALIFKPSQLSDITSAPTYTTYASGPKTSRSFCSKCGSGITWRSEEAPDTVVLMSGTLDEKWLVGEKVEGTDRKTAGGVECERRGALGREICTPKANMFWENAIPGLTDHHLGGKRFLQDTEGWEGF